MSDYDEMDEREEGEPRTYVPGRGKSLVSARSHRSIFLKRAISTARRNASRGKRRGRRGKKVP